MDPFVPVLVASVVLFGGAMFLLVRHSQKIRRELAAYLLGRGFSVEPRVPEVRVGEHRLQLWQVFTGPFSPTVMGAFLSGFTQAPSRRGSTTSYLGVSLPESVGENVIAKLQGAALVGRQPDRTVLALWQVMDTPEEAAAVLEKVATALS